jgi:hypothetical protein
MSKETTIDGTVTGHFRPYDLCKQGWISVDADAPLPAIGSKVTLTIPDPPVPPLSEWVRAGDVVVFGDCTDRVAAIQDHRIMVANLVTETTALWETERFNCRATFLHPGPGAIYEDAEGTGHFLIPSNYDIEQRIIAYRTRLSDTVVFDGRFPTFAEASAELYRRAVAGGWKRVD